MRLRAAGLATALVVGVGCNPNAPTPSPAPAVIDFVRCGEAATGHLHCGQLDVPESNGTTRELQVVLVSDQETAPLAGRSVLVYHPGGPGISAVELLEQDPPGVDLARFVLLAWDGTTASSTPGACGPESSAFGTNRIAAELGQVARTVGEECLHGFGGPADVGALAAAEELEAIRRALPVEQVDLLAISYGTAIAEAYLRAHPTSVRRAVLDAPIALEVPWPDRLAAVGEALTNGAARLLAACRTAGCRGLTPDGGVLTYPHVRSAVLDDAPTVGSGNVTLTPTMLDQATLLALRSPDSWPAWAEAIEAALSGDGTALWALGEKEYFDLDRSVFYRSFCADIDRPVDPAAYGVPADPFLVAWTSALAPCSVFPHRDLPAGPAAPGGSGPRVLIIASEHDVLAPAVLLESAPVLSGLAALCMTDVEGHTSYHAPGIAVLVSGFLVSGGVAARGACVSSRHDALGWGRAAGR